MVLSLLKRIDPKGSNDLTLTKDREIFANAPERNTHFPDNVIITSKYTFWNFVPIFLFEQFMRLANAYFLFVGILQCIPQITITSGAPTGFVPLALVLTFDGIVTAREDYKRHVDDNKANNSKSKCRPVLNY